jgi:cytochrome b561
MSPYPPALILLHWLSAILLGATFLLGIASGSASEKTIPALIHGGLGLILFTLTLLRLAIRLRLRKPTRRAKKNPLAKPKPLLAQIAVPVQWLLYLITLLMSLSGMALTLQAGVFSAAGLVIPADFYVFPLRAWHTAASTLLFVLFVLHLLTWVYYQFLRGENALQWIWFHKK